MRSLRFLRLNLRDEVEPRKVVMKPFLMQNTNLTTSPHQIVSVSMFQAQNHGQKYLFGTSNMNLEIILKVRSQLTFPVNLMWSAGQREFLLKRIDITLKVDYMWYGMYI